MNFKKHDLSVFRASRVLSIFLCSFHHQTDFLSFVLFASKSEEAGSWCCNNNNKSRLSNVEKLQPLSTSTPFPPKKEKSRKTLFLILTFSLLTIPAILHFSHCHYQCQVPCSLPSVCSLGSCELEGTTVGLTTLRQLVDICLVALSSYIGIPSCLRAVSPMGLPVNG